MNAFFQPGHIGETATVYEHCAPRARRSLASGQHGLPLIGHRRLE